jgi:hypothetical protein
MFKALGQTWRSIASVVIAYILILILFVWGDWFLYEILGIAKDTWYNLSQLIGGNIGTQPGILFDLFISPGAMFMTFMILFARVVVLSLFLWLGGLIVDGVFGKSAR